MKFNKLTFNKLNRKNLAGILVFAGVMFSHEACQQNTTGNGSTPTIAASISCSTAQVVRTTTPTQASATGINVMPIYFCNAVGDANVPCVSVTICSPSSPTTCQTINNILLDTGSFGLRIFSSLITVSLTQVSSVGKSIAECALFGIGATWGPVQQAMVTLGGETSTSMPIQTILDASQAQATFPVSNLCASNAPNTTPAAAGYNGILGVGPFAYDCGSTGCSNPTYYGCLGGTCTSTSAIALYPSKQVINPVYALSQDNNGVILALPGVNVPGATSDNGTFIMGIGTQSNNTATGLNAFPMNSYMNFTTNFNGVSMPDSFIDSGTNTYSFPYVNGMNNCAVNKGWYCPNSPACYTTTMVGSTGTPSLTNNFRVDGADSVFSSGVLIAPTVATGLPAGITDTFDWGLPFFLGHAVYVGFQGRTATGISITGPYWAF